MSEIRLDLGGGAYPRPGFVNVDLLPAADVACDFEKLAPAGQPGPRLPFADGSVAEVYSSHTLEHLDPYVGFLHEVVRVCREGASVEIRVPHWNHDMARCAGHKHAVSDTQVRHWCVDFPHVWFAGCARRLEHLDTKRQPDLDVFAAAAAKFRPLGFSDDDILRFVPGACAESQYLFRVVPNR